MSEEKAGYSSLGDERKPKQKKKYLYLDNFNRYAAQQQEIQDAGFNALWRFSLFHGVITTCMLIIIMYLLSKI